MCVFQSLCKSKCICGKHVVVVLYDYKWASCELLLYYVLFFFSSSSVFIHLVSITNKYNTKYTHRQIYPLPAPSKSQYPCILFGVNLLLYNLFMFSMSYCIECLSTSLVVCFYLTTFLFFEYFFLCNNTNCKIKHHLQQLLNQAFGIYRKEFDYSVTSSSCSLLLFWVVVKKELVFEM